MLKLVRVKDDYRFGESVSITPATFTSPRGTGFEYAIVNEFVAGEHAGITDEQARSMFHAGVPLELLAMVPAAQMKQVHEWRMKNEPSYAKLFEVKESKPKTTPKAKAE